MMEAPFLGNDEYEDKREQLLNTLYSSRCLWNVRRRSQKYIGLKWSAMFQQQLVDQRREVQRMQQKKGLFAHVSLLLCAGGSF